VHLLQSCAHHTESCALLVLLLLALLLLVLQPRLRPLLAMAVTAGVLGMGKETHHHE
jgi:H+/gluconate symporter-like permease